MRERRFMFWHHPIWTVRIFLLGLMALTVILMAVNLGQAAPTTYTVDSTGSAAELEIGS